MGGWVVGALWDQSDELALESWITRATIHIEVAGQLRLGTVLLLAVLLLHLQSIKLVLSILYLCVERNMLQLQARLPAWEV